MHCLMMGMHSEKGNFVVVQISQSALTQNWVVQHATHLVDTVWPIAPGYKPAQDVTLLNP